MTLSPRRQLNADRLAAMINWRGRKVFLSNLYLPMRHQHGMQRYAVDAAADDLFQVGAVEMRVVGDDVAMVLLHPNVETAVAFNTPIARNRRSFAARGRA